ncbi:hypothetical protein ACFQMM_03790 [Saliphagus sp. GCM10025308]
MYLAGLVHFGLEHENALSTLALELQSIGAEPNAIWTSLSTSRHGISTPFAFVSSVELVAPPSPLEPIQWYGVLAGIVGLSLLFVLAARVVWREETWGPISLDETIVVGIALTAATMVVGGPLLAGSVLMPLLIGVVVHRTHQLPGGRPRTSTSWASWPRSSGSPSPLPGTRRFQPIWRCSSSFRCSARWGFRSA